MALSSFLFVVWCATSVVGAQDKPTQSSTNATPVAPAGVKLPSDYVIGVEDVLAVVFWKEKELSAEVVVRPDGKMPMLNDVDAVGMTPQQLAAVVEKAALKFVRDPGATVMVREIRSRKVYVIGEVAKPGTFPISSEMNVLQAIAQAGGFLEHANKGDVVIVRGKNTQQNIRLLPGDTILVR